MMTSVIYRVDRHFTPPPKPNFCTASPLASVCLDIASFLLEQFW